MSEALDRLRILEFGIFPVFRRSFPAQTTYIHIGRKAHVALEDRDILISLRTLPGAMNHLRQPWDLVVVNPTRMPPWWLSFLSRATFSSHTLAGDFWPLRAFGQLLPLLIRDAPVVVLDLDDHALLFPHQELLLRRAAHYFKRELPIDRWRLFNGRSSAGLPSPRFRSNARRRDLMGRIRPIPLGLPDADRLAMVPRPVEKSADVFFAGAVDNRSTERRRAIETVRALAATGLRVDIADAPLPPAEMMQRAAAASLVLSPEGLGWDCFRHYEAAAAWSVPLMSFPTIERAQPLLAGIHCVFYDPSADGLVHAIRSAIADPARLAAMGTEARQHVARHHTPEAICRYVAETALAGPPSEAVETSVRMLE